MTKHCTRPARFSRLLITTALLAFTANARSDSGEIDLLTLMTTLQTMTHKTQLALDAGNAPLAGFYAHELEEATGALIEIVQYDDHPIGKLARRLLVPSINALETALRQPPSDATLDGARQALDAMVVQCNACHEATDHGFIVIERNAANPFAQSFKPRP